MRMQDKFRVFDISDKCYVKVTQLNFDTNASLPAMEFIKSKSVDPDGFKYVCYRDQLDKFIFEQCTGLKDKNGKLIYEGDIVRYHVVKKVSFPIEKEVLVLKTKKVTFKKGYFSPVFNLDLNDVEIIGNIHENPEMLG